MSSPLRKNNKSYLDVNPSVKSAIDNGEPIVALESTIICHGMPYPKNLETALHVEKTVKQNGATPATVAILDGRLKAGISEDEMHFLAKQGDKINKVSRRDIPFSIARQNHGATTVAATMIIASLAKISVFATGGIGGVHRDINESLDISADLIELAKTNVAVVCSGVKSILDIPKTMEYLETHGVPVIGYKTKAMPAFYSRESECLVDYSCENTRQIAEILKVKWDIPLMGGMVVTNPIPEEYSIDSSKIANVINDALKEMKLKKVTGKRTTPFLLSKVAEKTGGDSLEANIQLVLNNARLAAKIASDYNDLKLAK